MILNRVQQYLVNFVCVLILQTVVICEKIDSSVSLVIDGNGFHRTLSYRINFDKFLSGCYVSIYLKLPSGLYVNDNELSNLRRFGISTACSSGEVDIEVFTEKAQTQDVTICSLLTDTQCSMKLPVHQRYHYASKINEYVNITLPEPKLLIGCKNRINEYRVSNIDLCSPCTELVFKWREIPYVMYSNDVLAIPVGDITILPIVTYITLLLTVSCTIYLMRTIWKSEPRQQHQKQE